MNSQLWLVAWLACASGISVVYSKTTQNPILPVLLLPVEQGSYAAMLDGFIHP
jgi:hypothetical protein